MVDISVQVFFILLAAGVLLLGAELYLPGGFIGAVGAVCLLLAIVAGFKAFPEHGGAIGIGIIALGVASIVAWMTVFPKTKLGKRFAIKENLSDSKSFAAGLELLVGQEGIAQSSLRPSGYAEFEGRRVDVVTRGEMLDKGTALYVAEVEGSRVVVADISERSS